MMRTGLIAVVLAVLSYIVFEPSLGAVLMTAGELFGVVALFCLVCVSELLT